VTDKPLHTDPAELGKKIVQTIRDLSISAALIVLLWKVLIPAALELWRTP